MSRRVVFQAARTVVVEKLEPATPASGQVRVDVALSAISAGTELLVYRGQAPSSLDADVAIPALAGDLSFPLVYGYAVVGRVSALGADVDETWLGRRVFAFHPHEGVFLARPGDLHLIPDDLADDDAVLLPNVETAVSFLMDGRPVIGERVVVFGQGIVGLLTTALLARLPLAELIAIDLHPARRALAERLGATRALHPEATSDLDVDLAYELSGAPQALDQALQATGDQGRVVIGSWYGTKTVPLQLGGRFHRSGITLLASQVSTLAPRWQGRWTKSRRLDVAWEAIRHLRPSHLVSHRFPVTDADQAYRLLDERPGEAVQVVLEHGD